MELLIYIIVLVFETIYFTLFMKYSQNKVSLWKYLIVFTGVNIALFILGSLNIFAYLIFMVLSIINMKIVGIKVTLYDLFFLFIMLLFKLAIELVGALTLPIIISNIDICKIILGIIKMVIVITINWKFSIVYSKLKKYWDNNNFYIRYVFSILMFIYTIAACVFLINYR